MSTNIGMMNICRAVFLSLLRYWTDISWRNKEKCKIALSVRDLKRMLLGRFQNNMPVVSALQLQCITCYVILRALHTDSHTNYAYRVFPSSIKYISCKLFLFAEASIFQTSVGHFARVGCTFEI